MLELNICFFINWDQIRSTSPIWLCFSLPFLHALKQISTEAWIESAWGLIDSLLCGVTLHHAHIAPDHHATLVGHTSTADCTQGP